MEYKNAKNVLPRQLLCELQKYVHGELLYIPTKQNERRRWGQRNGSRQRYRERNDRIRALYAADVSAAELARQFFLSEDSIRKIVRKKEVAAGGRKR